MADLLTHIGEDSTLRKELVDSWEIADLLFFKTTSSTQDVVKNLAERGAPEWTVAVADEQTAGRGRNGAMWHADPGSALLFSVLLRPTNREALLLLPIRIAMVLARSIDQLVSGREGDSMVKVKWPNDLIIQDRKLGGVLVEASVKGNEQYAVIGIGLNVFGTRMPVDHTNLRPAFLEDFIPGKADRLRLLDAAISALRGGLRLAPEDLMPQEVEEFSRRDWLRGKSLSAPVAGRAVGINRHGHLLVEGKNPGTTPIMSGSVVLAP